MFGNPYKNLAADKFYMISEPNAIRCYRVGGDITLERKLITLLTKITEKTGSMKDYIVEQGTKDIWTYRKWNSGIAECWFCVQGEIAPYTQDQLPPSAPYGFVGYWNLPFKFIDSYTKLATVSVSNGIGIVASGGLNDTLSRVCLHWASNTTGTSTINMKIIGRWK